VSGARPASDHAPLIVVSNRLPYDLARRGSKPPKRNVGGLVSALEPVLERRGGLWLGWDGAQLPSSTAVKQALARPRTMRLRSGVALCGVPLTEREFQRFYNGACNRALWPLFHDFPGRAVYHSDDWKVYVQINRRFAEACAARARRGDRLWIHDYQLMLVPTFLRELGLRNWIDFYLHIPFPAAEIFRALPWRDEVVRSLLSADALAFHIDRYRDNFVEAAAALVGSRVRDAGGSRAPLAIGRTTVAAEPIGLDVADFERLAVDAAVETRALEIRAAHRGRAVVFGAERLDYTKGLIERLLAVEAFVRAHPEAARRFVHIQVVVPSRHQVEEYRLLKRELDRQVGRINGELGADGWQPIHYHYRALDRRELVAHYRAASVAVVSPLRDGMNLVAPEFVASRVDGDGVLVLSEFAGVAELLRDALLINPNHVDSFGDALARALDMPVAERRERMARMRAVVQANTATEWAERCLRIGLPDVPCAPEDAPVEAPA
jgi:trehalose 6-phosphate synthase